MACMITLAELHYVAALAEELHFGRAALRCGVSQPQLSMALKKLEQSLGLELFERSRTGVRLTAAGAPIIAQAQRALAGTVQIKTLAAAARDQLGEPLRLGVIATLAPSLLPSLLPYWQREAPRMPLLLVEDCTRPLQQQLEAGALDAIVVSAPFGASDLVTRELFDEPLLLLAPHKHPLAHRPEINPAELQAQPLLVLTPEHCLRPQVDALCPWLGEPGAAPLVVNSLETLRQMVAAGLGLGIVPRSAADLRLCRALQLAARPLGIPARRQLLLAYRTSFPRHRAIDVLQRAIQTCAGAYWSFTTEPDSDEQRLLPRHW